MEKKDAERERPVEVEWETGRHQPRERSRERESGTRASLRSKYNRFVVVKASTCPRHLSLLEALKECRRSEKGTCSTPVGKHQFLIGAKELSLKIRSMIVILWMIHSQCWESRGRHLEVKKKKVAVRGRTLDTLRSQRALHIVNDQE